MSTIVRSLRFDRGTIRKYARAPTPTRLPRSRRQPGVLQGWTVGLDQRGIAGDHQV